MNVYAWSSDNHLEGFKDMINFLSFHDGCSGGLGILYNHINLVQKGVFSAFSFSVKFSQAESKWKAIQLVQRLISGSKC